MQTTQTTYNFGNLEVTQTIIENGKEILKLNDVSRFNGEYWEILSAGDPDYSTAIILMHNDKNFKYLTCEGFGGLLKAGVEVKIINKPAQT